MYLWHTKLNEYMDHPVFEKGLARSYVRRDCYAQILPRFIIIIATYMFYLIFCQNEKIKFDSFLQNLNSECLYINSWDFKGPFDENKNIFKKTGTVKLIR